MWSRNLILVLVITPRGFGLVTVGWVIVGVVELMALLNVTLGVVAWGVRHPWTT